MNYLNRTMIYIPLCLNFAIYIIALLTILVDVLWFRCMHLQWINKICLGRIYKINEGMVFKEELVGHLKRRTNKDKSLVFFCFLGVFSWSTCGCIKFLSLDRGFLDLHVIL